MLKDGTEEGGGDPLSTLPEPGPRVCTRGLGVRRAGSLLAGGGDEGFVGYELDLY